MLWRDFWEENSNLARRAAAALFDWLAQRQSKSNNARWLVGMRIKLGTKDLTDYRRLRDTSEFSLSYSNLGQIENQLNSHWLHCSYLWLDAKSSKITLQGSYQNWRTKIDLPNRGLKSSSIAESLELYERLSRALGVDILDNWSVMVNLYQYISKEKKLRGSRRRFSQV